MIYTVLGVYDDGIVFQDEVISDTPYEAMSLSARNAECPENLTIIGAIAGRPELHTPGEDNNSASYAIDLQEQL